MSRVTELQKKYRDLAGQASAIRKAYEGTAENMSDDDATRFDAIMADADRLEAEIEREKKSEAFVKRMEEVEEKVTHPDPEKKSVDTADLQMKAFVSYFNDSPLDNEFARQQAVLKTLQADLDVQGGYLQAPPMFVEQLLKAVDDAVFVRRLATVIPLRSTESLGVVSLDTQLDDADWTTELATGNQDDTTRFGKRELRVHPFAKRVKISNTLMRLATRDPEALIRDRIAYKFSITEEKAFLTGNGANRPLGLFTASAQGISTSRDVTAGTTTLPSADGLIDAKHTLKSNYLAKSRWLFHRTTVAEIRKLKDGIGNYIWQPGLQAGLPNVILDLPYEMSEYVPNTLTTGQYFGMVGDFSFYWIADGPSLSIQRLNELYAETNVTGFIARAEADGMPVLEEAFIRMKLA